MEVVITVEQENAMRAIGGLPPLQERLEQPSQEPLESPLEEPLQNPLEERLEDTELNSEQVMTIMEELHDRYFKPWEKPVFETDPTTGMASWPFPTGDKK
jgi:hypothetical protein